MTSWIWCLNHPNATPNPQSVEKLYSTKLVPQKGLRTAALHLMWWPYEILSQGSICARFTQQDNRELLPAPEERGLLFYPSHEIVGFQGALDCWEGFLFVLTSTSDTISFSPCLNDPKTSPPYNLKYVINTVRLLCPATPMNWQKSLLNSVLILCLLK